MSASRSASPTLTLISYNIHHGQGMDRRIDLPRVAGVLRDSGADVACLQEVDCRVPRSRRVHQPRQLAKLSGMKAVFGPTLKWAFGALYGNALLTSLPLEKVALHDLPGGQEQRGVVEAHVLTDVGPVAVFCTHWGLTDEERVEQASFTARLMRAVGLPALLAGDLNESPDGAAHALLRGEGLARLGPDEPSFPSGDPTVAIDHVYGSPGWRALDAYMMPSLASDHQPVIVELEFRPDR